MFNSEFYPTESNLAIKMACMISPALSSRILEPSAGKGDLCDAIRGQFRHTNKRIDCIEPETELQHILSGKGYDVIDSDFLSYSPTRQYDTILMNPPFSHGASHVLKAWDILYNGDVIAIINAETIKNPHSKQRKLLSSIVNQNGTVEYIQGAFKNAERKTGVEVALVHLKKRNSVNDDYFNGVTDEAGSQYIDTSMGQQLAIPQNRIENMVIAYNKAVECKRKAVLIDAEAEYYSNSILGAGSDKTADVKKSFNQFVDDLRAGAWTGVINLADFQKYATEQVRKQIRENEEVTSRLEFTSNNINTFLKNLAANFDLIINECILDVFDQLTRYHKENRVYIEGWKSNDYFFINKRVVLPDMTEIKWAGGLEIHYSAKNKIRDIERVMSHLSGLKDYDSIIDIADQNECLSNFKLESTFFDVRFYKKGTAHFYFKDLKLLERFNLTVGRQRGWLPKQDNKVPEQFWLMNK